MKLSIVTICYNDKAGFERTAKSIIAQNSKDFEWIIVDGASTDGSVQAIEDAVRELSALSHATQVIWKSEPDKGIYNAMNKGIRQTHGEYVQFLNSGDYLLNADTISRVMPFLEDKDLYVADICHSDDPEQKPGFHLPVDLTDEQLIYQLTHFTLPHPSSFFRRDYFDRFGYFDESLKVVSDWKIYFQSLILSNASIQVLPFVTTVFDTTGISCIGSKADDERKIALYETPRMNEVIRYYRETYEMGTSLLSKWYGRFLMRIGFFIYRKFNK